MEAAIHRRSDMHLNRRAGQEGSPGSASPSVAQFDAFYAAEAIAVLNLAYVLTGNRQLAEDLTQEAFLAAYRNWDRVSQYDRPGAFVRRVVANRRVSAFRKRMNELTALAQIAGERNLTYRLDLTVETEEVWNAVRRLPRRQSQVVALLYVDGLSLAEVAEVLGISKESVNTHMRRARATLAVRLNHWGRP